MNPSLNPQPSSLNLPSPRAISGEGWAAITGIFGSAILVAKKLLNHKGSAKPEPLSRGDFYAQMSGLHERLHATHLALLEKLDANHRELLAALERQVTRINALESGLARLDERTRSQPSTLNPQPL